MHMLPNMTALFFVSFSIWSRVLVFLSHMNKISSAMRILASSHYCVSTSDSDPFFTMKAALDLYIFLPLNADAVDLVYAVNKKVESLHQVSSALHILKQNI